MQGLILVFVILALFLDLKLAFWVALGIPISLLGACIVLWQCDQTLNMLSLFSFLIALGIVVDDAIVIGENVYAHRQMGKTPMQAAIDGTIEVVPSVFSSVATTVFAFMPMFFVTGIMGKFFAVMPLAVIAILTISLIEASMVLPCHLAHDSGRPFADDGWSESIDEFCAGMIHPHDLSAHCDLLCTQSGDHAQFGRHHSAAHGHTGFQWQSSQYFLPETRRAGSHGNRNLSGRNTKPRDRSGHGTYRKSDSGDQRKTLH